ncbi:IS4 family transposase [Verminephrobacter aporrectodeae subsp. tuberculatae]|uniref:IS4 family transposase n=1 Tax=Verminephrobacter aporrectodeae TaxID=1110389 RepID=UPI0022439B6F|nr:IS4 family transposase [Verminephrobacter aporrectodeae]MCW8205626.1 IS4 family transposase [Verminephrobacter aporrectodeae subsp. tuberculatae]
MARVALERAIDPGWVDEVFEASRQRQYPRELLFSTVVEMVTLVSLGLRPSLHAAAKQAGNLPVSLAALYDKVKRTEPAIVRALVHGSGERLQPVVQAMGIEPSLPGWRLRVLDGNHLPASEKRLAPLREQRGAALPGYSLVVYDPDSGLVRDIVACEDAYTQERSATAPLLASAQEGELWIADRNFCTYTIMQGWHDAKAGFIVREHAKHPKLLKVGAMQLCGRIETGEVHEQAIEIRQDQAPWRRIELRLDTPTEAGDTTIALWSNLPSTVSAQQIAQLYRKRWRIEEMFQRLESVLHSELRSLGHPRAALLGFAVAVLAYNVLSVLKRSVEQAHRDDSKPALDVSTYHLAVNLRSSYEGMLIALPAVHWTAWSCAEPQRIADRLLELASHLNPRTVSTAKRGPKIHKPKGYVDATIARSHVSTARVLMETCSPTP